MRKASSLDAAGDGVGRKEIRRLVWFRRDWR